MSKKIILSGAAGMAGSHMAEYLLNNTDLDVYGMVRRSSTASLVNLEQVVNNPRFKLIYGDITDDTSVTQTIFDIQPDYFINFAAITSVASGWITPFQMMNTNCFSVIRILESIRKVCPTCRFLSLGSSEEIADAKYTPQDIDHPISPRNLYGSAKASARTIVDNYRNKYNLYAVQAICYNFESERKSSESISKKITSNVARISFELENHRKVTKLKLGSLENRRDFSSCLDFCDGFWRILNQELYNKDWDGKPKNYLLAGGESHSITEFVEVAFQAIGIDEYEKYIEVDSNFFRPTEKVNIVGDARPAREELGWSPKFSFGGLVDMMVKQEVENYLVK